MNRALFPLIVIVFFVTYGFSLRVGGIPRRGLTRTRLHSALKHEPAPHCCHRVSILTEIPDHPGSLHEILKYFWKYDINLTHIESRPVVCKDEKNDFRIFIDFDGQIGDKGPTDKLMSALKDRCKNMLVLDEKEVPWFPRHISELYSLTDKTLDAGADLQSDHPGFNDPVYRKRREELAAISNAHSYGNSIPRIKYTAEETKTWGVVYNNLQQLSKQHACQAYNDIMPLMEKHCGYSVNNIPQVEDISQFLKARTGFQLCPVTGLLSSRDFLSGLAYRMFFSTQYIRHSSKPLYTPEPDICHELLGHAPMFADPDFADFSQEIGLASLGASDEEVKKLATCYWFSVEFGLVRDSAPGSKAVKAYGAGLLSSFGELEYSCAKSVFSDADAARVLTKNDVVHEIELPGDKPKLLPWDPKIAGLMNYPICTYQPTYFVANSLADAKDKMRSYCERIPKPFYAKYNPLTESIWVDRAVKLPGQPEPQTSEYYSNTVTK